jgi:quinol monooxygenase YgiN
MSTSVKVIALLIARPGKAEELAGLLAGMVGPSRAEQGNLQYDVWQDEAEGGRFVVEERYRDNAAAAAHHATPHFAHYRSRISDLAERTALVLDPLDVADTSRSDDANVEGHQDVRSTHHDAR